MDYQTIGEAGGIAKPAKKKDCLDMRGLSMGYGIILSDLFFIYDVFSNRDLFREKNLRVFFGSVYFGVIFLVS
jgi:hypothetical protein